MILESGRGKEASDKLCMPIKRNSNLDTRKLLMAIDPHELFDLFDNSGVTFYTGIPDSLLKEFCLCVDKKFQRVSM